MCRLDSQKSEIQVQCLAGGNGWIPPCPESEAKRIRAGVKTKVLMLSATPINNRFNDLKNHPRLFDLIAYWK